MARKTKNDNRTKSKSTREEDFEKVDIFLIPKPQAEMYRILREAVAADLCELAESRYASIERITDPDEGEAIVGMNDQGHEVFRFYLNPQNISQAQKARDKDQLIKLVEVIETQSINK